MELARLELPTMKMEADVSAAALTAAQTAAKERDAFAQQQAYFAALSTRTDEILDSIEGSLHVLTPKVAANLDSSDTLLVRSANRIDSVGAAAQETVARMGPLLDALTAQASDPEIKDAVTHLDQSAVNAAAATKDAAGAMKDVHQVTTYEAKQITAPVSKAKAIALEAARFAGKFLGF